MRDPLIANIPGMLFCAGTRVKGGMIFVLWERTGGGVEFGRLILCGEMGEMYCIWDQHGSQLQNVRKGT